MLAEIIRALVVAGDSDPLEEITTPSPQIAAWGAAYLRDDAESDSVDECVKLARAGSGRCAMRAIRRILTENQGATFHRDLSDLRNLLAIGSIESAKEKIDSLLRSRPLRAHRALTDDEIIRCLRHYVGVLAAREDEGEMDAALAISKYYSESNLNSLAVRKWATLLRAKLHFHRGHLPPDENLRSFDDTDTNWQGCDARFQNWLLAFRAQKLVKNGLMPHHGGGEDVVGAYKEQISKVWRTADSAPERSFAALTLSRLMAQQLSEITDQAELRDAYRQVSQHILLAGSQALLARLPHEFAHTLVIASKVAHGMKRHKVAPFGDSERELTLVAGRRAAQMAVMTFGVLDLSQQKTRAFRLLSQFPIPKNERDQMN